jgi:hypothetical protein
MYVCMYVRTYVRVVSRFHKKLAQVTKSYMGNSLTVAQNEGGGEQSTSHPGGFIPGERARGTLWIRGWFGLRGGPDRMQ